MNLIDRMQYLAVRKIFRFLGAIPPPLAEWCAQVLGTLFYKVAGKHRRVALENLQLAFGDRKPAHWVQRTARQVFINMLRIVFEYSRACQWDENQLARHVTVSGLEEVHTAMAKKKGVLLLGAHFGNWELLPIVNHMAGIPVGIAYRTLDAPALDQLFVEMRSRYGEEMIPNQQGAMRRLYRFLRRGNAVGLLMDQGVDYDDGVFVDFFNRPAASNIGLAALALKTRAPVVPMFLIRRTGSFHAVYGPELPLIETGDHQRDIEENTQLYNHVIEIYARRYPDQWFWLHQRWKNLPFCPWPRTNLKVSNRY